MPTSYGLNSKYIKSIKIKNQSKLTQITLNPYYRQLKKTILKLLKLQTKTKINIFSTISNIKNGDNIS